MILNLKRGRELACNHTYLFFIVGTLHTLLPLTPPKFLRVGGYY